MESQRHKSILSRDVMPRYIPFANAFLPILSVATSG